MAKYVLGESAARKLGMLLRGKSAEIGAEAENGAAIDDAGYAAPFSVRWSGSETQSGCWVVYIGSDCIVTWNGVPTAIDQTVACEVLPSGWKRMSSVLSATGTADLYLIIDNSDPEEPTARFSNTASSATDRISIKIASVSTNVLTGEKKVHQLIIGAIVGGTPNNGQLTLVDAGGSTLGTFTADQEDDSVVTIPSPNNGQLTIKNASGSTLGTFTANQSSNTTITLPAIPEAPNNGQLTINDAGGSTLGTFTANQASNTTVTLPAIPAAPNNGQLTINDAGGNLVGTFTANQASNTTITLPSGANDGTLTITTYNGSIIGTFTANQASSTTIALPEIPTPLSGTVEFVGDMRYDLSAHQLQKRVDTLNLATGAVVQGQWVMITGGQCSPHSAES